MEGKKKRERERKYIQRKRNKEQGQIFGYMKPNKTVMRRLGLNYSQTVAPPRTSVLRTRDLDSTPPPQNPRAQASKMGLTSPPSSRVQESFWFWVIFKGEKIYADDLITNP